MAKGNVVRALVVAVALCGAAGSAWAGEVGGSAWASRLDPAALGALAALAVAVILSSVERRRRERRQRELAARTGRGANVTPISVELRQASGSGPSRRAAGRQR